MNLSPLSLELTHRLERALVSAFGETYADSDPLIRASRFSDVQSNLALALAKPLGLQPRAIAEKLVENFDLEGFTEKPEVSGPGFINFKVTDEWLSRAMLKLIAEKNFGIPQEHERVVIDYSSPNVAKEMHVGHLRTTIVGDTLARVLETTGATVIRQNHIGDWGTPFGMLIELLLEVGEHSTTAELLSTSPNKFYQLARSKFDTDSSFAQSARERVVKLQSGELETLRLWSSIIEQSRSYFNSIYSELEVDLTDAAIAGESSYNEQLEPICEELLSAGIASMSEGAVCVFFPEYPTKSGEPAVLILRKSDGGFGYAATDLAALRYRVEQLQGERLLYVVGAPQELHFKMVKTIAKKAGWLPETVSFEHVMIGNVLDSSGKMLKTRSGEPVLLKDLLQEAVSSERESLSEKGFSGETLEELAHTIGIGAVKYADLSVNHSTEYVYEPERMLALQGNTGPYLQYAAVRVRSILRKLEMVEGFTGFEKVELSTSHEKWLALKLLDYGALVKDVSETTALHTLCLYLFELAQTFNGFYENCPIAKAEPLEKATRVSLAKLTLATLESGLKLLGLKTPEVM